MGATIVSPCDGHEAFLTRRIPELERKFVVLVDALVFLHVDADGGIVRAAERVDPVDEARDKQRLADAY